MASGAPRNAPVASLIGLYTLAVAEFPDSKIDGAEDNDHENLKQIWNNIEPAMQINFNNCWRLMLHANAALGNMQNLSDAARAVARQNLVSRLRAMKACFDMVYQAGYLGDELEDLIVGGWLDKNIRIEQGHLDVLTAALRDAAAAAPPSNSAASDPEHFFEAKFLGKGTYGDANLFLRQNSDGTISDRMVIKKSEARPGVPWLWAVENVPNEVTAMESLQACEDSDNVVKLRNWAIREDKAEYKLYMEFCEHGDLEDFAKGYDPNRQGFIPAPSGVPDHIPEPFAWSVFEGLVKAGLLMLQGDTETPDDGWKEMVHRDIKPANVFLGKNTTKLYRHYPIAKLGDFGMTVLPQPRWTAQYAFRGNKAPYMPPELCNARILRPGEKNPSTPGPHVAVSEKTNVWMVGHTMWAILSGKSHDVAYLNAIDDNGLFSEEKAPRRELNGTRYSQRLRTAIYACVQYQPSVRPTFESLYNYIRTHTHPEAPDEDFAKGLRRASANLDDARKVPLKLRSDFFAVGSKVVLPGDGTIPAPPPARTSTDPPTPDNVLFGGTPGRRYLVPAPPPISGQGAKRDAPDEGEGGPPQRRRTGNDATPTSAARGGASPGESARP